MKVNDTLHGFTVTEVRELPELHGAMVRLTHGRTGMEVVWLDRDDDNKTFGIGFETLPRDDTGVSHILEHSVLCGSDRYPVKEPFVELLKSSMNTFLNAITFPDKTIYPISSRNDKDFINLTRVYLDAVFRPAIYRKPEIFRQEGWHYAFDEDGNVSYRGVVFNEMKGAMADPDDLASDAVYRALFPDNAYRFNSGGDPAKIPDLSYEAFLNHHRRYYSPSNAYVFIDGKADVDAVLAIMEDEYLKDFERTERIAPPELQKPVDGGTVEMEYELGPDEDPAKRSRLTEARVVGRFDERVKLTAAEVLANVLCGDNQAPLRRVILDEGLAESVDMNLSGSVQQPTLHITVKNFAAADRERIEKLISDKLESLAKDGIDKNRLAAMLANEEFRMREMDVGSMPVGLIYGMNALDSWLYGGDPAQNLEVGDLFDILNKKAGEGYFEQLIRELWLDNPHRCKVLLTPSKTAGEKRRMLEAERLDSETSRWSDDDRKARMAEDEALKKWQESEDTPEELATLPKLAISDVSPEPQLLPTEKISAALPVLMHRVNANGIVYAALHFDVSELGGEEISHLSFLCTVLGKLSTEKHTVTELADLKRLLCGRVSFTVSPYTDIHTGRTRVMLQASYSALEKNLDAATELVTEILTQTKWDEDAAARDLIRQEKQSFLEKAVVAGNSIAIGRVTAMSLASGVAAECASGLSYYKWMAAQENAWSWDILSKALSGLLVRCTAKKRLTLSVTCLDDKLASRIADKLAAAFADGEGAGECTLQPMGVSREGIVIPADIAFAVTGGLTQKNGGQHSGLAVLARQIVSFAYLWNVIRVQGGAYGTGLVARSSGLAACYSYRDPSAAASLEKYKAAAGFLRDFAASGADLTGFIIGAAAGMEPLMTPSLKGATADACYWSGVTHNDERRWRSELLGATNDDLIAFAGVLEQTIATGGVSVVGGRPQIDACKVDRIETL